METHCFVLSFLSKKKIKLLSLHYQTNFFTFFSQKIQYSFHFYTTSIKSYFFSKKKSNFFFHITKQLSSLFSKKEKIELFSPMYRINQFLLLLKNKIRMLCQTHPFHAYLLVGIMVAIKIRGAKRVRDWARAMTTWGSRIILRNLIQTSEPKLWYRLKNMLKTRVVKRVIPMSKLNKY